MQSQKRKGVKKNVFIHQSGYLLALSLEVPISYGQSWKREYADMPRKPHAQREYPGSKLTNYLGFTIYVELMEDQFNVSKGGGGTLLYYNTNKT